MKDDIYFTELDIQLRELAINDWATFYKLIGEDAIKSAKVCMLRTQGKSIGQIQLKLNLSKMQVRHVKDTHCCYIGAKLA